MSDQSFQYTGELELFEHAVNWKSYWSGIIRPFIRGRVLEVGAGTATNTPLLHHPGCSEWVCLEPDPNLAARVAASDLPAGCVTRTGVLADMDPAEKFDTILYIDVLEHISDDNDELDRAASMLRPGGHLVVLAPAHQWLYSPFDRAVGHVRRYSRKDLLGYHNPVLKLETARYMDCVGMLASIGNRLFLKAGQPKVAQIKTWDRLMVPLSRLFDPMLCWSVGKSVLVAWIRA